MFDSEARRISKGRLNVVFDYEARRLLRGRLHGYFIVRLGEFQEGSYVVFIVRQR